MVVTTSPGAERLLTASLIAPSSVNADDRSVKLRRPWTFAARQRRPRWLAASPGLADGRSTEKM